MVGVQASSLKKRWRTIVGRYNSIERVSKLIEVTSQRDDEIDVVVQVVRGET